MTAGKLDLNKDLKFGTLNAIEDQNVKNSGDPRRTSSLQALNAATRHEYSPNTLENIEVFRGIIVHKRSLTTPRYQNRGSLLRGFLASPSDLPEGDPDAPKETTGNDQPYQAEPYTAYKVYVPELDPRPAPSSFNDPVLHTYPDVLVPPGRQDLKDLPLGAVVEITYEDLERLFNPQITGGTGDTFILMANYEEEQSNNQLMFGSGPVQLMSDTGAPLAHFDGQVNVGTGLLIGDSQSDGGSTLGGYLPKELATLGIKLEVEAKYGKGLVAGKDYWDIENKEGRVQQALARVKPSFVVVELGGNDSYWVGNSGPNSTKRTTYEKAIYTWVSTIESYGRPRILWFGPSKATKVGENNVPYDNLRQNVRTWQKEALASSGATWYDTVPYTNELPMQTDGVHFVAPSYKAWAKALVETPGPFDAVIP